MREDAFRAYLAPRLGGGAVVTSYLSNARLVEKRLHLDIDRTDLSSEGIASLCRRLVAVGVPPAKAANSATVLRRYADMISGGKPPPVAASRAPPAAAASILRSRHAAVTGATVAELMRLYGDILGELRDRGVSRTANGPVGDYAEHLFASAFEWQLTGNSETGYDALDNAGTRYQVKGRRLDGPRSARHLGAIRRLSDAAFDYLSLVLFSRDMSVIRAALIPRAIVADRAGFVAHTNSWRMMAPDRLWSLPGVVDATDALRGAAA